MVRGGRKPLGGGWARGAELRCLWWGCSSARSAGRPAVHGGAPAAALGSPQPGLGFGAGSGAAPPCAHRGVSSAPRPQLLRLRSGAGIAGGAERCRIPRGAAPGGGRAALQAPARRCVPVRHPGTPSIPGHVRVSSLRSRASVPSRCPRAPPPHPRQPQTGSGRALMNSEWKFTAFLPCQRREDRGSFPLLCARRWAAAVAGTRGTPLCRPEAVRSFPPRRLRVAPGAGTALRAAPSAGLSAFPGGRRKLVRITG